MLALLLLAAVPYSSAQDISLSQRSISGGLPEATQGKQDFAAWALVNLNMTYEELFGEETDFLYEYGQSTGHFKGPGFDGSVIDVVGCSGIKDSRGCRNNPAKQCEKSCGPLPRGDYRLSKEITYKGMPHCYALTQISGDSCGRSGFLIHGGSCEKAPTPEHPQTNGCIIIEDVNIRYKIKGGGKLTVQQGEQLSTSDMFL
eukprot:TRINITY_DN108607_c0_g1_i1.p1 TRINITY_DN108607_c0_g1~~TRINITY_DN108607_c0_g1_i1.p1  ORF type:complete len:219 (+),score=34.53 TRINITY_DN108607_c0_g1_i1:57-659(+)